MSKNSHDSVFMLPSGLRKKEVLEKMVGTFKKYTLKTSVFHKCLLRAVGVLGQAPDYSGEHVRGGRSLLPQ